MAISVSISAPVIACASLMAAPENSGKDSEWETEIQ